MGIELPVTCFLLMIVIWFLWNSNFKNKKAPTSKSNCWWKITLLRWKFAANSTESNLINLYIFLKLYSYSNLSKNVCQYTTSISVSSLDYNAKITRYWRKKYAIKNKNRPINSSHKYFATHKKNKKGVIFNLWTDPDEINTACVKLKEN